MDAYVENLAYLMHDELCNDKPRCARGEEHLDYYREKARSIISQLEPESLGFPSAKSLPSLELKRQVSAAS